MAGGEGGGMRGGGYVGDLTAEQKKICYSLCTFRKFQITSVLFPRKA